MTTNLILLFKDRAIPDDAFEDFADIIVHNQYISAIDTSPPHGEYLFEAEEMEWEKLKWFTYFSQLSVLYILDRSEDVRKKLTQSSGASLNYRFADIVLVQYQNTVYTLKDRNTGNKQTMSFLLQDMKEETSEVPEESVLESAAGMRKSFIYEYDGVCSECDYSDTLDALDFYVYPRVYPKNASFCSTVPNKKIEYIRFGKLRDFNEVFEEIKKKGHLLCRNCAVKLDLL